MRVRGGMNEISMLIGAWLFLSPWAIGFADPSHGAAWVAWVLGMALVITGFLSAFLTERAEEAITFVVGALTLLSPWLFSFANSMGPAINAVVVGLLIAAVALRAMLGETAFGEWLARSVGCPVMSLTCSGRGHP